MPTSVVRETDHAVCLGDARALPLPDDSVELVVTSPPYPMIEQWDDLFARLNPAVRSALDDGDGWRAFESMHETLGEAWAELRRVLVDGGIACVNVGDATRTVGGRFRLYPNHTRVVERFADLGFDQLPGVLWRKPTNAPTKFMGSGTLPPNAYVTLEHEHLLVFRNGGRRSFESGAPHRYQASYFWEERNRWFSDLWDDLAAESQTTSDAIPRDRSAAFPLELPYRLVCMYTVYGDTVLDPFWGTGTTTLAAMAAARNSVAVDRQPDLLDQFDERVEAVDDLARERAQRRLRDHRTFLADRDGGSEYDSAVYDFVVVSKQERRALLYRVDEVTRVPGGYRVTHAPVEDVDVVEEPARDDNEGEDFGR
jgi:DNA modification methylase